MEGFNQKSVGIESLGSASKNFISNVRVRVYTISTCKHCVSAKELFDSKGTTYENINIEDPVKFQEIFSITQQKTVPQIFIGEEFIGGYDKLTELDSLGMLDLKLGTLFNFRH